MNAQAFDCFLQSAGVGQDPAAGAREAWASLGAALSPAAPTPFRADTSVVSFVAPPRRERAGGALRAGAGQAAPFPSISRGAALVLAVEAATGLEDGGAPGGGNPAAEPPSARISAAPKAGGFGGGGLGKRLGLARSRASLAFGSSAAAAEEDKATQEEEASAAAAAARGQDEGAAGPSAERAAVGAA